VRLPIAEEYRVSTTSESELPNERPALPSRRVLVVDDNVDAAESLGLLLRFLGADVEVAHDGPSALERMQPFRPELVLLDIGMPGMDGYEVAARIRALPSNGDVTVIALTGWGQSEDRARSHAAGFDRHLVKPVDIDTLEALLQA
jgi:CheY-like chemotaxis protein